MDSKDHAAEELAYVRSESARFLQQRNRYAQIAVDLAGAVRLIDPVAMGIDLDVWRKARLAMKEVDLGRGAGERYEWPR